MEERAHLVVERESATCPPGPEHVSGAHTTCAIAGFGTQAPALEFVQVVHAARPQSAPAYDLDGWSHNQRWVTRECYSARARAQYAPREAA